MLWLDALQVRRGAFALGPVTLEVPDGELLALVGPNGSGKTTLLSALLGQVDVVGGGAGLDDEVLDLRSRSHLARIGYVPDEEDTVYPELTATEYYSFLARVRGRDVEASRRRADDVARRLGHQPGRTPVGGFSHGMRKKTQLVAALMHDPDVLLVDELGNGLDALSAAAADQLVEEARSRGAAVLVSTHDLGWVERRADRVAVVHGGRLLATGPLREVRGAQVDLATRYLELVS